MIPVKLTEYRQMTRHIIWMNYHTSLGYWSIKSFITKEMINCWSVSNIVYCISVCVTYFFNYTIIWHIPENIQAFLFCKCTNTLHKLCRSQFMSPTRRTFLHYGVNNILSISPSRDSSSRSFMLLFWDSTIKYKGIEFLPQTWIF